MFKIRWAVLATAIALKPPIAMAQEPVWIVDARINQFCHPPDSCVLRGGLIWDTTNVTPRYPEVMRSVGIDGEVLVTFGIRPDGSVADSSIVITRITNRAFEQSVRDAVRRWKFRIESSDHPTAAIPTAMSVIFALADGCSEGMTRPITSLMVRAAETRLIVMACRDRLISRN